ncbi:MAG: Na/Pi cotransporter family protein, partial [Clostridia bacterium]|nr:Na/Pi cotransporter family protein [Clostridia bacterium]
LIMPFSKQLEKLSAIIVKEKKGDQDTALLDDRLLHTPSVAVQQCKMVADDMAKIAVASFKRATALLENFSEKEAEYIRRKEDKVDKYEDALGSYLVKLSSQRMTEKDSAMAAMLLHIIGDFERISDHAVNIVESAEEMHDKKLELSASARKELSVMIASVHEILDLALDAFVNNNLENPYMIEALEEVVDHLRDQLKRRHVLRLQKSECTIEMGFILSDLLINFERVSDHCSNIGGCVLEVATDGRLDIHDYLKNLKDEENDEFKNNYEYYKIKYAV